MKFIIVVIVLFIAGTIADDETKAAKSEEKSAENEEVNKSVQDEITESVPVVRDAVTESETVKEGEKSKNDARVERATPREADSDETELRSGDSTTSAADEERTGSEPDTRQSEPAEDVGEKNAKASDDAKVQGPEKASGVEQKKAEAETTEGTKKATADNDADTKKGESAVSLLDEEESEEKLSETDDISHLAEESEITYIPGPGSRRMMIHGSILDAKPRTVLEGPAVEKENARYGVNDYSGVTPNPGIIDTKARTVLKVPAVEKENARYGVNDYSGVTPNPGIIDSHWQPASPSLARPVIPQPQVVRPDPFFKQAVPIPLHMTRFPNSEPFKQLPKPFLPQRPVETFQHNFRSNEFPVQNSLIRFQNVFPALQTFTPPTQRPLPIQTVLPLPLPKYLQSNYGELNFKLGPVTEVPKLHQFLPSQQFQGSISFPRFLRYRS